MDTRYSSRKFMLACFFSASTTVGLYFGHLDGGTYVAAIGMILGLYSTANVMGKKNGVSSDS